MRQFSTLPGFRSTGCFSQIKQLLDLIIVKLLITAQPSGATVANERAAHWGGSFLHDLQKYLNKWFCGQRFLCTYKDMIVQQTSLMALTSKNWVHTFEFVLDLHPCWWVDRTHQAQNLMLVMEWQVVSLCQHKGLDWPVLSKELSQHLRRRITRVGKVSRSHI